MNADRRALLERHGRLYGELHLAIAWTITNTASEPDDTRPKKVTTEGWQHTIPLGSGKVGADLFGRGLTSNPTLVLRPSGLVGIECDTEEGLAKIAALELPETVTVCSSKPYKRHFWFRPPPELEQLPFVAFRFEEAGLRADRERYLLCPPSLHPSGATYHFLDGHAPNEIEIATMPVDVYRRLVAEHDEQLGAEREQLVVDPEAKVGEGHRRETIFRFACMQRRWSSQREVILAAALAWNTAHCEPPLTAEQVAAQVDGAMRMRGGQELAAVPPPRVSTSMLADVLKTFRAWLHFPDPQLLYLNVAAELANRMEEGDPVWLMDLGGSSRGKTELLNAFAGLPHMRVVGSLTEAALLSGTPKKERAKNAAGGLLRELPTFGATLVVKDFGAILTLPRDRRAIVVQALRDIYDGRYVRDVGTAGGQHLEWHGRLGLIAGATGSLDSHHGVIAALGERWLTLRLANNTRTSPRTDEEKMARRALRGSQTQEMRAVLADTLGGYVAALVPPAMRDLDDVDNELLVALSVIVTAARSPVERDPRTREIELVPQGEGPPRFARQLHKLALCLYTLELKRQQVHGCLRRLALDSITPARRQALEFLLATDDPEMTAAVAVELGLPTGTARRVLEDLNAHGLLDRRKVGSGDKSPFEWCRPSRRANSGSASQNRMNKPKPVFPKCHRHTS